MNVNETLCLTLSMHRKIFPAQGIAELLNLQEFVDVVGLQTIDDILQLFVFREV